MELANGPTPKCRAFVGSRPNSITLSHCISIQKHPLLHNLSM
jgi:hypothetical protein